MVEEFRLDRQVLEREFGSNKPILKRLFGLTAGPLMHLLQVDQLNQTYAQASGRERRACFADRVLDTLGITYSVSARDLRQIPRRGPVVVVANHAYGGIDGIVLSSLLLSVRSDIRVMANYLLGTIPGLREILIQVDPFKKNNSINANIKALRETIRYLNNGGMIAVFPAGGVTHLHLRRLTITDPVWNPQIARIVRKTKAAVLPVFFPGANSKLFQLSGLVHPWLRTLMLPRELLNKRSREVKVRVGKLIPFEKLNRLQKDEELAQYLRVRTYILKNRTHECGRVQKHSASNGKRQCVAPPQPPRLLAREVQRLPKEQELLSTNKFSIYTAMAEEIPRVMEEIGRLREITFRSVGEGTGRSTDIDSFDQYYMHLFLWEKVSREVVGAYRLGLTDQVLQNRGREGLYTYTLFEFGRPFLAEITPAIELGRSFVRLEYQKNYQPLLLLWKGIGSFVSQRPQYKMLFGPVSINSEYNSLSRRLMVEFLKQNNHRTDLARLVKARNPVRKLFVKGRDFKSALPLLQNMEELSEMVSEIEEDRKGVPVLIRQYVKLGGKFLGFSIDHNFSDVLDALILVDLSQTEGRILSRYMGKEGAESFLHYHRGDLAQCA
jgi:putative hemolysin